MCKCVKGGTGRGLGWVLVFTPVIGQEGAVGFWAYKFYWTGAGAKEGSRNE